MLKETTKWMMPGVIICFCLWNLQHVHFVAKYFSLTTSLAVWLGVRVHSEFQTPNSSIFSRPFQGLSPCFSSMRTVASEQNQYCGGEARPEGPKLEGLRRGPRFLEGAYRPSPRPVERGGKGEKFSQAQQSLGGPAFAQKYWKWCSRWLLSDLKYA